MRTITKPCLSLYVMLLVCVCDVYTSCSAGDNLTPVTSGFSSTNSKQYPSVQFIIDTYYKYKVLNDKCFSAKAIDLYKIASATNDIDGGSSPSFIRKYYGHNGNLVYRSEGEFFVSDTGSSNSHMSFRVLGAPPGGRGVKMQGRTYFVKIEPPPRYNYETSSWTADKEEKYGGSALTYYSCFYGDTMDVVYVVQTPIKIQTHRAEKNVDKSKIFNNLNVPYSVKPINCY